MKASSCKQSHVIFGQERLLGSHCTILSIPPFSGNCKSSSAATQYPADDDHRNEVTKFASYDILG
jgi:hypothetical protein